MITMPTSVALMWSAMHSNNLIVYNYKFKLTIYIYSDIIEMMMLSSSMQQFSTSYFILGCVILWQHCALLWVCGWHCNFSTRCHSRWCTVRSQPLAVPVWCVQLWNCQGGWWLPCVWRYALFPSPPSGDVVYNSKRAMYMTLANTCSSKYVVFYDIYGVLHCVTDGMVPILFILICNCIILNIPKKQGHTFCDICAKCK